MPKKFVHKVAKGYEKKGMPKKEAESIGWATANKKGLMAHGKETAKGRKIERKLSKKGC